MAISNKFKKFLIQEIKNLKEELLDASKMSGEIPIGSLKRSELIDIIKTSIPGNTDLDKILEKFPSLKEAIVDLFTEVYRDYIENIIVIAPKPTTFKVILKNSQVFYLTYADESYIAQISGKKYNLLNLQDQQRALKSLTNLLNIGNIPQTLGPSTEVSPPSENLEEKPRKKPTGRPPKDKKEEKPEEPEI